VVAVICVVFSGIFLAQYRILRRRGESDLLLTVLSYPTCILATLMLFPAHTEFAVVVVSVLAFGDGSAFLGGKLFGGPRLPWNANKSVAGSLTFVLMAAPMASLAYWNEARNPDGSSVPIALAMLCGTAAAVLGAIAESWRTRVTDNLRVGVAAAIAVVAAHFALAPFFLG
jgi:dolichol kinase